MKYESIKTSHYVALSLDKVAAILGWTIGGQDDDDFTGKTCNTHASIEGEGPNTIISIEGYAFNRKDHKKLNKVFGDTTIPDHLRDRLIGRLDALGHLGERTVLVEADGDDKIWGWAVSSGNHMRIVQNEASGFSASDNVDDYLKEKSSLLNTIDETDQATVHGTITALTAVTYHTADEASYKFTSNVDEDMGIHPQVIDELLFQKAVGQTHIWGILNGPLMPVSHLTGDSSNLEAPEGFGGLFVSPKSFDVWVLGNIHGEKTVKRHTT